MADEYNWIPTTIVGLSGTVATMIAWLLNRTVSRLDKDIEDHTDRLDDHETRLNKGDNDLLHFKAHVSDNYAKEATMQSSLSRIHSRIDSLPKEIVELISKIK